MPRVSSKEVAQCYVIATVFSCRFGKSTYYFVIFNILMVTMTFATFQAKDYELRQYETAKWVSTVIRGETQKEATRQGFWKLFHYIRGKNEKGTVHWF